MIYVIDSSAAASFEDAKSSLGKLLPFVYSANNCVHVLSILVHSY